MSSPISRYIVCSSGSFLPGMLFDVRILPSTVSELTQYTRSHSNHRDSEDHPLVSISRILNVLNHRFSAESPCDSLALRNIYPSTRL